MSCDWFAEFVLAAARLDLLGPHYPDQPPAEPEPEIPPPALQRLRLLRPDLFG